MTDKKVYIRGDEEQIKEMIALYETGMSYSEIGAVYGVKGGVICYIFGKISYKARKYTFSKKAAGGRGKKRKVLDNERLKKLYLEEKRSVRKIAETLKETPSTVRKRLIEEKIPLRTREDQKTSVLTADLLKRLFIDQGRTAQQIANQTGYSVFYVNKRLNKFNLKRNNEKQIAAKIESDENNSDWLTTKELAQKFNVKLGAACKWIRNNKFPNARRISQRGYFFYLVPSSDVKNFTPPAYGGRRKSEPRFSTLKRRARSAKKIIKDQHGYGKAEILEMMKFKNEGLTSEEIAARFGLKKLQVEDILAVFAVEPPKRKKNKK